MDDFTTVTVYFETAEDARQFYQNIAPNLAGFVEADIS